MGALVLPASGLVYLDANSLIYSIEKHPIYGPLLQPLWQAAKAKAVEVVSSDLVLMEVLSVLSKAATPLWRGLLNGRLRERTCACSPSPNPFFGKRPNCGLRQG